ncbi:MAG: fatty-acid oxidation protein subunit alpha [Candidatus Entotheonella factor]|uniref:Fatty-acid oxidation protein subunit alpha n=1 Tax=Entotheonella factor TaxID=1429438 RepID=W4LA91_ENTF1|nr:MAG: fatty-acid oxidation protein subunit alpha [Candidatus Entotheonella factor]
MPARDIYHDTVIHALEADGWQITHDPLTLSYGGRELYVDLGAQRTTIAAEKMGQKIAVEIKSFLGLSPVQELEQAIGQYQVYHSVLRETESDRKLYLAVPQRIKEGLLAERFGQLILNSLQLQVLVFDEQQERIVSWIP